MADSHLPRVAYRGFLSYSHKDTAAAAKLHRRLETYTLPKHLLSDGAPPRLTPIFRDREELSAGNDLSVQVQEALSASDALIILCSPQAKESRWVNKEIETFRALHPDRPILAAIVEGEPEDAFPEALTSGGHEPIAADLRKGKDGWKLGQLKIISAMAAVPLDALVQRDAQRQLRRVMAITIGAGIAVLIMAALLVFAVRSQKEAERQRAEAEGLVEYMLTDLRDRLKGVGRLDVMTAVNERAMGYYGGDSVKGRLLKARTLHALGEDDEKRGDHDLSLNRFTEARRTTAAIVAQRPNDADAIFAHAQSEYWVGFAMFERSDTPRAMPHFRAYRDLAYRLTAIDPKKPDWIREVGYGESNLCAMALQEPKRPRDAIASCSKAAKAQQQLLALKPSDTRAMGDLANALAWQADAHLANLDQAGALEARKQQLAQLRMAYAAQPDSAETAQNLMLGELSMGEQYLRMNDLARAREHGSRAKRLTERLQKTDAANKKWQEWNRRIARLNQSLAGESR